MFCFGNIWITDNWGKIDTQLRHKWQRGSSKISNFSWFKVTLYLNYYLTKKENADDKQNYHNHRKVQMFSSQYFDRFQNFNSPLLLIPTNLAEVSLLRMSVDRPHYSEEIWKRTFHPENASNVFPPHYTGEIYNAAITGHLGFVFEENSGMEITWFSFAESSVFKMFFVHTKTQSRVSKFLRFEERFRKALFLWRTSVDGSPNRVNKAAFSNSSGVAWTGPVP